jgi:hypothetical protein
MPSTASPASRWLHGAFLLLAGVLLTGIVWVLLLRSDVPAHGAPMPVVALGAAGSDFAAAVVSPTPVAPVGERAKEHSSLGERPPPLSSSRHYRRSGLAWILRPLGASDAELDGMTQGGLAGVVARLKERAVAGDSTAINVLGVFEYWHCYLARSEQTLDAYQASQITQSRTLAPAEGAWLLAALGADVEFDKQVASVCRTSIDSDQVRSWVTARAAEGWCEP